MMKQPTRDHVEQRWERAEYATTRPSGTFDGTAWSYDVPLIGLINRAWRGKHFEGATVTNRILGHQAIAGKVTLEEGDVVIRYGVGLEDRLRPEGHQHPDGTIEPRWLGRMELGSRTIWFTLTSTKD